MDLEVQRQLAGRLLPGERILWSGQPRRDLVFTASDIPITLLFLLWTGTVLGSLVIMIRVRDWLAAPFILPFLAIGFYMLVLRFEHDAWIRRYTYYAITDRQILIWRDRFPRSFRSFGRASLSNLELIEDGACGTIRFGPSVRTGTSLIKLPRSLRSEPELFGIDNARGVFDLLLRTQPRAAA